MKKFLKWTIGVVLVVGTTVLVLFWVYLKPFIDKMKHQENVLVDSSFRVITGGGGNSGIISSDSLLLVIDTKMDDAAKSLFDTVQKLAGKRPILVINTHWHPDHVGGNKLYKKEQIMAGGSYKIEDWTKESGAESLPGRWVKDELVIPMGTDTAIVFNLAKNVHTPSDVMVYFKQRQILFGGDVILNQQSPALLGNASAMAYMDVLYDVAIKYPVKMIVPGHGSTGGPEVITNFLAYFEDMREAAEHPEKKSELIAKYKQYAQVPFFMSPGATVSNFEKELKKY